MLNPNQEKDCWRQYSSHFCVHSRKGNTIRIGQHKCNTGKASFKWLAWYYITLQIMFCYFIFSKWILENTSIKEENICIYGYLCNASYGTQITNFCLTVGLLEKNRTLGDLSYLSPLGCSMPITTGIIQFCTGLIWTISYSWVLAKVFIIVAMTAFIKASVPTSTVINVAPQQFTPQKRFNFRIWQ